MRYALDNESFCHHVDIKMTIHLSSSWKVSFVFPVLYPYIYSPPPHKDEVLVMLDRDQVHFGISSFEENEIDLNLGFQVQV